MVEVAMMRIVLVEIRTRGCVGCCETRAQNQGPRNPGAAPGTELHPGSQLFSRRPEMLVIGIVLKSYRLDRGGNIQDLKQK